MRVVLAAIGSRGDIEPMVALALGLRDRGHAVEICGSPNGRWLAARESIPFVDVGVDLKEFARANARLLVDRPGDAARAAARLIEGVLSAQIDTLPERVAGADLLVGSSVTAGAESVAEAYGVPFRMVLFTPQMLPSREHPPASVAQHRLPGWLNRLCWWATETSLDLLVKRALGRHRQRLGLGPSVRSVYQTFWPAERTVIASEPQLAPVPGDTVQAPQTGALFLDRPEALSDETERFLAAGPPPVYVGFGSMPASDPEATTALILAACRAARARAVISGGWADLGRGVQSDDVLVIGSEPHERLFPRLAAVVHHGGAGTTAAAFRAGTPQLVVPHLFDQFYWGDRVRRAGLGPRPIRRGRLTVAGLARAIDELRAGAYRQRAREACKRRTRRPVAAAARELLSAARSAAAGSVLHGGRWRAVII